MNFQSKINIFKKIFTLYLKKKEKFYQIFNFVTITSIKINLKLNF